MITAFSKVILAVFVIHSLIAGFSSIETFHISCGYFVARHPGMSEFDGRDASGGDNDRQQASQLQAHVSQPHNMLPPHAHGAVSEIAGSGAISDPAAMLRNCTFSVKCAFKRHNVSFLRDIYERHIDDGGWLPASNLAQALSEADSPIIPDSISAACALIERYNPDGGTHMKFSHFLSAVNEPDELQRFFEHGEEPVFADALRAIVGRGDDQLLRVSELSSEHLDIVTNAVAAGYLEQLLFVQSEVRRSLQGPFESAILRR